MVAFTSVSLLAAVRSLPLRRATGRFQQDLGAKTQKDRKIEYELLTAVRNSQIIGLIAFAPPLSPNNMSDTSKPK